MNKSNIIEFWDKAGLANKYSSTFNAHLWKSISINQIENKILQESIDKYSRNKGRALDIGAGYGCFGKILSKNFEEAVLIEPAKNLFIKLKKYRIS